MGFGPAKSRIPKSASYLPNSRLYPHFRQTITSGQCNKGQRLTEAKLAEG